MKIIAIMSCKGGVGKSTVTVNIARALYAKKYKVGILDGDVTSPSIAKVLNIECSKVKVGKTLVEPLTTKEGIKLFSTSLLSGDESIPIMFTGNKKRAVIEQFVRKINWGDIDYLLIDLAPGVAEETIEIIDVFKKEISGVVMVTTPSRLSINSVRKLLRLCEKKDMKVYGVVSNMTGIVCPHCNNMINVLGSYGAVSDMCKEFKLNILAVVPLVPEVEIRPFKVINYFNWVEKVLR